MSMRATALAHPNIAFIKYWGLKDEQRRIPANDSISMNIGCLSTQTSVVFDSQLKADSLILNEEAITGKGLTRVQHFLDRVRLMAGEKLYARVESENNFPTGAGIASSASAFSALALAATAALDLNLNEKELSSLARYGSGSACRSIPGGFVEWRTDQKTNESYAVSIAPADHWELADCIAILSKGHKPVGSEAGMSRADTSPFQAARVRDAERRMKLCRQAILDKDFETLAHVTELDSNLMHAVMMTSDPPLFYWHPQSLAIMKAVKNWQSTGLPVTYTLDAGPNVHVICLKSALGEVLSRLNQFPEVINILKGVPAGPARLVSRD
ncbi:MAG: diphosphomevalonate decarboxylase [Brevefilum sp.]